MPLPLESHLAAAWPPESWQDVTVVAAVSGGADSVALVRALATLKNAGRGRLIVAHFDHRLRPEAEADAKFVATLADGLGLVCESAAGSVAKTAEAVGDGIEAAARAERYAFLQSTAERLGARYVVTAHTADDQAETILHRILRGTAVAGLAGMRRARPLGPAATLIRPLLDVRRAEILDYLTELQQPFQDDTSNSDLGFTRNRIRHELLPRLAAGYNSDVVAALLRLGQTAHDAQQHIAAAVEQLMSRAVSPPDPAGDRLTIDCRELAQANRHLVRELFVTIWRKLGWPQQDMGFAEWDALAAMVLAPSISASAAATKTFPGGVLAKKTGAELSLERRK